MKKELSAEQEDYLLESYRERDYEQKEVIRNEERN
jgi:hypothetical protein